MDVREDRREVLRLRPEGDQDDTVLGAEGLLRTFSNIGMVSSFAMALLIASLSISRQMAFSIFLGVGSISGALSVAFIQGMHSALTASVVLLVVALVLSVFRGREARTRTEGPKPQTGPRG